MASLPPGTRLGPYDITSQIGAGGMGEVHRATDSHLKRSVAIKVLPDGLADFKGFIPAASAVSATPLLISFNEAMSLIRTAHCDGS